MLLSDIFPCSTSAIKEREREIERERERDRKRDRERKRERERERRGERERFSQLLCLAKSSHQFQHVHHITALKLQKMSPFTHKMLNNPKYKLKFIWHLN